MSITYTFPVDCPLPALRGVTCEGGKFGYHGGADVVTFSTRIDGQTVIARVAGKPELMAALAAHKAEQAAAAAADRAALELAVPGVGAYERARRAYINAADAYDRASDRGGYPIREGAAWQSADKALKAVHAEFPATVLWRDIVAYREAGHHEKSLAGAVAARAVQSGVPIATAHAAMEAQWRNAAQRCVANS